MPVAQKERYGIPEPVTVLTLSIGKWKKLFADDQIRVMLADSLNYSITRKKGQHIPLIGYLITGSKMQLVFDVTNDAVQHILLIFKEKLGNEIRREMELLKQKNLSRLEKETLMQIDLFPQKLFYQTELTNDPLIRLITGQLVELPYYSPKLARLKREIFTSRFCSVVDYSGEIGPVNVTLLKPENLLKA